MLLISDTVKIKRVKFILILYKFIIHLFMYLLIDFLYFFIELKIYDQISIFFNS